MEDQNNDNFDVKKFLEQLKKLKDYGKIEENGEFTFERCEKCNRPNLGHKNERGEACEEEVVDEDDAEDIQNDMEERKEFNIAVDKLDKRESVTKCDQCGGKFANVFNLKIHKKS